MAVFVADAANSFESLRLQSIVLTNNINRMGELEPWIDENFVRSVWFNMGEQVNVKMIRDKFSGYALSPW